MTPHSGEPSSTPTSWWRLLVSVLALFALFHGVATALGSLRGEGGLLVGGVVVAATLAVRRFAWRRSWREAGRDLGLSRPAGRGLLAAAVVAALLVLVLPVFIAATGSAWSFYPGWWTLLPGLFLQGGLAEETLFRGFLFGAVRQGQSFWRAAWLSAGPFLAAHLLLFAVMPWPIALASCALAVVTSFPLAHLYELGGRTVWAPALLHFVIQSGLKVVEVSGPEAPTLPLVWIAAAALVPWLVFVLPRPASVILPP